MIDKDIFLIKAERVQHHVKRIKEKKPALLEEFLSQLELQEIILFNLQMAIQHCIDMASHVISDEGLGMPGSTNEMFYMLQDNGYIPQDLTEKMVAAVGFRNLLVHEYGKVDLEEVYRISHKHIDDLLLFLKALFKKIGLVPEDIERSK
jgi:uncharacterized protein YutE (UPF0331/DUF86 family)